MTTTTKVFAQRDSIPALFAKKILVIDDDSVVGQVVSAYLRKGGFKEVRNETDSRNAIVAIREYRPDMILLDVFMPNISGLELLEQISANSEFDNIIVLMLSSAGKEEENKSLEMGAMGFLPKPAKPDELIRIISTTFRIANRFGTR